MAFVVARMRDGEVPPDEGTTQADEEQQRWRYLEWLQ